MSDIKQAAEKYFMEMAQSSKKAIEDFNDMMDDQAIVWAYEEIKRLQKRIEEG